MKRIVKCCIVIALGFAVTGYSIEDSIVDRGHKGVQLWKDGPYWAETNIGAENPWDYGYYFWWGDTVGYKRENDAWVASDGSSSSFSFKGNNTPTFGMSESDLGKEGWITADGVLVPKHDAAHVHWGGDWRMPTKQELKDICEKCDWTVATNNGVYGWVVRGKETYSSHNIFLPFSGFAADVVNKKKDGTSLICVGSGGYYWSSLSASKSRGFRAWNLFFDWCSYHANEHGRCLGQSVRPVQKRREGQTPLAGPIVKTKEEKNNADDR